MTPTQCRMARAALDLTSAQLSKLAGVGLNSVNRLERGHNVEMTTVAKIRVTLEAHGIVFREDEDLIIVGLRKAVI
jgi:hypothetical protein